MRRRSLRGTALRLGCASLVAGMLLWSSAAPGTVAEQRARLPPPATCEQDDIEGVWKSHQYDPRHGDWTEFTLEIRRVADKPGELLGKIFNHSWDGPPTEEQPGPCKGAQRYRVSMEAVGTFDEANGRILFRATRWKLDEVVCGALSGGWGYNLDRFTGTVEPERQEFQSVNNDGGRAVNDPTVFRRVRCLDDPAEPPPSIDIEPPAIFPKRRAGGCSC